MLYFDKKENFQLKFDFLNISKKSKSETIQDSKAYARLLKVYYLLGLKYMVFEKSYFAEKILKNL